jgi:hypothetical protein
MWKSDKIILPGNSEELGKTSLSANLSTSNVESTGLGQNPALGGKASAT